MTNRTDVSDTSNVSRQAAIAHRLAVAGSGRARVDHNGNPIDPPTAYHYGLDGRLVSVERSDADDTQ